MGAVSIIRCEPHRCSDRVGGVPENITSDKYGLFVDPADPEDLTEKIQVALQEWGRKTILEYVERFTWENIAGDYDCLY
jgi:glycosyltransferase involved in cell wall biosynthesis